MKIQHDKILAAARQQGISVKDISDIMNVDAAILEYHGRSELLVQGTPTSLINSRSQYYCDNKALTKEAFDFLGIPSPRSILFQTPEENHVVSFFEAGKKYVCKPPDGTNGVGVEMHISSLGDISSYLAKHQAEDHSFFMLEEQIEGEDLRVQVVGGRIVAVCTREPAHVVGDGTSSLQELISALQKTVKAQNPANNLVVDQTTLRLLGNQQIELTDVPQSGKKVILKELANMAQGAVAIDKTDQFHPGFQLWVDKLVTYLGTSYFAIDIIAPDLSAPPEQGAYALEINARPEWLHHTFSRGRTHDLPGMVLDAIFGLPLGPV
ncbi:MAG: hypothetical protein KDC85_08045 [Saprospiraceae bacterium]|nr:hypothetical protein [Saprospiraceae bacterium]MCB9324543.1 hypothetical protein [Lewinellaceae bacterium]